MQHLLVIDKNKIFLMPCHPARARELLRKGKAAVYKRCPFRIILKEKSGSDVQDLQLKLDPGSKTTTMALVAEFQHGELAGYEVREYLCKRLINILARAKAPLKDGAASNSIRYATGGRLQEFGLQVSFWSRGRTTYNRTNQSYGKSHWLDAVCVGATGGRVHIPRGLHPLHVSAAGRGSRQMCRVDTYGFPRTSAKSRRVVKGFKTGDLVRALVNKGKKPGTYVGRVSVRKSGSFNSKTEAGTIQGISWKHCSLLQGADGYNYYNKRADFLEVPACFIRS